MVGKRMKGRNYKFRLPITNTKLLVMRLGFGCCLQPCKFRCIIRANEGGSVKHGKRMSKKIFRWSNIPKKEASVQLKLLPIANTKRSLKYNLACSKCTSVEKDSSKYQTIAKAPRPNESMCPLEQSLIGPISLGFVRVWYFGFAWS